MHWIMGFGLLLLSVSGATADGATSTHHCELHGDGTFTLEFTLHESWGDQGQGTVSINGHGEKEVWFLRTEQATLVFNSDDSGEWLAMFDHQGDNAWGALHDGHGDMRAVMRGDCSHD